VRDAPGALDVALVEQRVDEPAEVAFAQRQARGSAGDLGSRLWYRCDGALGEARRARGGAARPRDRRAALDM
jgi:hypothetical protein